MSDYKFITADLLGIHYSKNNKAGYQFPHKEEIPSHAYSGFYNSGTFSYYTGENPVLFEIQYSEEEISNPSQPILEIRESKKRQLARERWQFEHSDFSYNENIFGGTDDWLSDLEQAFVRFEIGAFPSGLTFNWKTKEGFTTLGKTDLENISNLLMNKKNTAFLKEKQYKDFIETGSREDIQNLNFNFE